MCVSSDSIPTSPSIALTTTSKRDWALNWLPCRPRNWAGQRKGRLLRMADGRRGFNFLKVQWLFRVTSARRRPEMLPLGPSKQTNLVVCPLMGLSSYREVKRSERRQFRFWPISSKNQCQLWRAGRSSHARLRLFATGAYSMSANSAKRLSVGQPC